MIGATPVAVTFERMGPRITAHHTVPVTRQIAAFFECAIRDGLVEPGAALPSTRVVAGWLAVHRNTIAAAYRLLCDRRLATGGPGSPMRVWSEVFPGSIRSGVPGGTGTGAVDESPATQRVRRAQLVGELIERARSEGISRRELGRRMALWLADGQVARLCLVEPRPGLRITLATELRHRLEAGVIDCRWPYGRSGSLRGVDRVGTLIVARPGIAERLVDRFPGLRLVQPLVLAGGFRELRHSLAIRRPGVVALLTRSRSIRRYARDLAAGYHARGVSLTLPDPGDPIAVQRAARIARLVLMDASCGGIRLETRARARPLRVLSEPTMDALRWHLGRQ